MDLVNGRYVCSGNIALEDLAKTFGTPLYVYDAAIIERQFKALKNAFHVQDLQLNFACKALTNMSVLKIMKHLGAGLDTVSIQEVKMGLKAGFQPQEILYTPNCVGMEEIEAAVKLGVKINIDNLSILELFGHEFPDYPVCVRLNPHIMAGGNSKISTGHIDSKFGISIHQMPHLIRIVEHTGLKVEGLHMHTGSDILDSEIYLLMANILFEASLKFNELEYLDFGSGFKVAYKDGDVQTNVEELGERLSEHFNSFCKRYGRDLKLVFEPGKYLVSESGYFLATVNVVKQTISTVFAGVDTGMNHFIRPMFYNAYHEVVNISNPDNPEGPKPKKRIYTVVGYICETDTLGVNRQLTEVTDGDVLCFLNAGAYCYAMSSNYNSRYRPAEVLVYEGKAYLIRRRECMEDLMRNQIEIPVLA